MRSVFPVVPLAALLLLFAVPAAHAFTGEGCGSGVCTDCHSLTRDEAVKILGGGVDNVLSVGISPVGGLWEVAVEKARAAVAPVHRLLQGVRDLGADHPGEHEEEPHGEPDALDEPGRCLADPPRRRDRGRKEGRKTQDHRLRRPELPPLRETPWDGQGDRGEGSRRGVLREAVPPEPGQETHDQALSIVCAGTVQALEDAFAGKPLPKGTCGSNAVDETIRTAERFNIRSTPTMIFPDGRRGPGRAGGGR